VKGHFEQGNYVSRKTNSVDIWNMQPMCITGQHKLLLAAFELNTSRRWLYGELIQTYYVGLLSVCLHRTGLLRFYVCCSLNAVGANSERNASYIVIILDSLHCTSVAIQVRHISGAAIVVTRPRCHWRHIWCLVRARSHSTLYVSISPFILCICDFTFYTAYANWRSG
jgi:hypothetical protein